MRNPLLGGMLQKPGLLRGGRVFVSSRLSDVVHDDRKKILTIGEKGKGEKGKRGLGFGCRELVEGSTMRLRRVMS